MEKKQPRVAEINQALLHRLKRIYRLRNIGRRETEGSTEYAYVVSLVQDSRTAEERIEEFCAGCADILRDGETLIEGGKGFRVMGDGFTVFYCIELWRKTADKIAYREDGQVKVELLHRMNCEQAAYRFKKFGIEPIGFLNTLETLQKYEHPAEKYAALAKLPLLRTLIGQTGNSRPL